MSFVISNSFGKKLTPKSIEPSAGGVEEVGNDKAKTKSVAVSDPIIRENDLNLPSGGFISATLGADKITFRITKVVQRLHYVTFIHSYFNEI